MSSASPGPPPYSFSLLQALSRAGMALPNNAQICLLFYMFLVYRIMLTYVLPTGGVTTSEECLLLAISSYKFLVVFIKT
jgi:hypothetical protein